MITAERLITFAKELNAQLPEETRQEMMQALREILLNAIEHGAAFARVMLGGNATAFMLFMINAIFQRDFPVVQGGTLVFGIMVVLIYLMADLAYAALDPRVRFDR